MPETFALVHFLNGLLSGLEVNAFQWIGIQTAEASKTALELNRSLALELIVFCALIVFFIVVRLTLSVEKPNAMQQIAEMIHEFTGGQADSIIGHGYERFQAFVTCIFLFVILNNLLGVIPGLDTPTANPSVPLAIAMLTFLYYNFHGVRVHGPIGYLKEFAGPIWWIAPLLFVIEIISHLARVMSLTIRLYANMLASDLVSLVFFSLMPMAIPVAFLGLHAAVSVIQAYVFMILSIIYLSMAVAHEEGH
jgi:F-type H+-transporting ATPase subunit a